MSDIRVREATEEAMAGRPDVAHRGTVGVIPSQRTRAQDVEYGLVSTSSRSGACRAAEMASLSWSGDLVGWKLDSESSEMTRDENCLHQTRKSSACRPCVWSTTIHGH